MSKIVIKVGSNLLVKKNGEINKSYIIELARIISNLKKADNTIILITSGARAAGYGKAQKAHVEEALYIKQALCAIGQVQLMKLYETAFDMYDEKVAQILINRNDFGDRNRFLNLRNTVTGLIEMGFIPIANENDTVSTEEITFGDNDLLAAMTAVGWKADYLILMSSIEGILDEDGEIIRVFNPETRLKKMSSSSWGTGGIETKINAGITAATTGIKVCICDGKKLENITGFLSGQNTGTTFEPGKIPSSRKAWIGFLSSSAGKITVNEGAVKAVISKKSLLPVGITGVGGRFDSGDVIEVKDQTGKSVGRGMVNFSSDETLKIMGHQSEDLKVLLGKEGPKVYIHADNFWINE